MAKRDSLYRPDDTKSAVVIGPSIYNVPLLPYERQLIATIGVTEEEYRAFTAEVRRRGAVRPAAYENIPDIQNALVTSGAVIAATYLTTTAAAKSATTVVLTNLAIGLTLTGVAYLLTPKPKMPRAQGGSVKDLGSITGANRFTPSRGFETLAELADYASPVPIIFGMYKNNIGGMLATPKLIWSRMFSHGTSQRAKLMFVVGEQGQADIGIDKPELEGIFLGNNPLDAIFKNKFAFYWHKASFSNNFRIRGTDKQYGTRGPLHSGDPGVGKEANDDIFEIENPNGILAERLFCHAYTPSNSSAFGCHSPIANGTSFRVNYQLNLIDEKASQKVRKATLMQRMKVVGESGALDDKDEEGVYKELRDEGKVPGQIDEDRREVIINAKHDGTGRNYSPRMGIFIYEEKDELPITNNDGSNSLYRDRTFKTTISEVGVEDKITFQINDSRIPVDFYKREGGEGEAPVDDINSTIESLQLEADGAMQLGDLFMIGGSIWKVIKRNKQKFEPNSGQDQSIELECIDTSTSLFKKIGIVSKDLVIEPAGTGNHFIGDAGLDLDEGQQAASIGEGFFPLTQVEIATIKNNRPAYITEVGLKSTVFQRLNGLCNFQNLPSPTQIGKAEEDGAQINNGTISTTIPRSSMFRVFVRDAANNQSTFEAIPVIFVVSGGSPVAQYNYISFINTPEDPENLEDDPRQLQLEFKFVPFPCSEFRDLPESLGTGSNGGIETFFVLDQSVSTSSTTSTNTRQLGPYTNLEIIIKASGKSFTSKAGFKANKEFQRSPREIPASQSPTYPDSFSFVQALPDPIRGKIATVNQILSRPTSGRNLPLNVNIRGKLSAFFHEIAGRADNSQIYNGQYATFQSLEFIDGDRGRWLHLEWKLRKVATDDRTSYSGQRSRWSFDDGNSGLSYCKVLGSGGGFCVDDLIEVKRGNEATNTTDASPNYSNANPFVANNPDGTLTFSGIRFLIAEADDNVVLAARSQAWRYEIFGAVDRGVGESKTISMFEFNKGSRKITVDLTSTVKEFRQNGVARPVVGQYKGWTRPTISRVIEGGFTSRGEWEAGETFRHVTTVSGNNPFFTRYSEVGQEYRVESVREEEDSPATSDSDLSFADQSQISDISFYRNFVEKSNSTAPEHEIVYINEVQINDRDVNMFNLTLAGFSLKAGRNFTALDQMRVWLKNGLPVTRLHPTAGHANSFYGDAATHGPSNLLTDLMYFMFTDQVAGAGGLLGMDGSRSYMVERSDLVLTSKFLEKNNLFFNGPIVERTNLRQFFSDIAPSFLCNFSIVNGKFSLKPAFPVADDGTISVASVQPDHFFTAGNILEDSYKIEYLGAEERRAFKAVVRYRQERANQLPEEAVVEVKGVDGTGRYASPGTSELPQEEFDLTQFCTSKSHAVLVAKYFLALRAHVTHTVNFSTTAEGLHIGAGSFIQVTTEATPYSPANTGTVDAAGVITSVRDLPANLDGYSITYLKSGDEEIETGILIVSEDENGRSMVEDDSYHDILFTLTTSEVSQNIYVVEQLTFSQDGIVDIVASEYPCNSDNVSEIALAVVRSEGWSVEP